MGGGGGEGEREETMSYYTTAKRRKKQCGGGSLDGLWEPSYGHRLIHATWLEWNHKETELERYRRLIETEHAKQLGHDTTSSALTVMAPPSPPRQGRRQSHPQTHVQIHQNGFRKPTPSRWKAPPLQGPEPEEHHRRQSFFTPGQGKTSSVPIPPATTRPTTHRDGESSSSNLTETSVENALNLLRGINLWDTSLLTEPQIQPEEYEQQQEEQEDLGDKSRTEICQMLGMNDPDNLILPGESRFTKDDYRELLSLMDRNQDMDETVAYIGTQFVKRRQMYAILDGQWLNDEVLNTGFQYLQYLSNQKGPLRIWIPNSYFMTMLYYDQRAYLYKRVRRWTKRAKVDITTLDRVIVPINLGNVHWVCACIFLKEQAIVSYDSMGAALSKDELDALRQWVSDETADKKGEENRWDTRHWSISSAGADEVPQQHNCCDCGVFMYCMCRSLIFQQPFDFSQRDMAYERRKLALDLVRCHRKIKEQEAEQAASSNQ